MAQCPSNARRAQSSASTMTRCCAGSARTTRRLSGCAATRRFDNLRRRGQAAFLHLSPQARGEVALRSRAGEGHGSAFPRPLPFAEIHVPPHPDLLPASGEKECRLTAMRSERVVLPDREVHSAARFRIGMRSGMTAICKPRWTELAIAGKLQPRSTINSGGKHAFEG